MTGGVTMKVALHIPPGAAPVHKRMQLNGRFALDRAAFASKKIQDRIEELSNRGLGQPKGAKTTDPASVESAMEGNFQMAKGVIAFPYLSYTVPGVTIQLKGTYGMEGGALDFAGTARMEATISKMVGGWKGMLLTPLDRHFEKNGAGTEIPIHIKGTRQKPEFGVEFGRKNENSAEQP
jgi:hypothetical protein